MKKINLNTLATVVTKKEGGKVSQSVAQVKEVIAITLDCLAKESPVAVLDVIENRKTCRWSKGR